MGYPIHHTSGLSVYANYRLSYGDFYDLTREKTSKVLLRLVVTATLCCLL